VTDFLPQILLDQNKYVYRLMEPERSTIVLSNRYDTWRFDEIKGIGNKDVYSYTLESIRDWVVENCLMDGDEFDELALIREIMETE
jgi:hypothetical protein